MPRTPRLASILAIATALTVSSLASAQTFNSGAIANAGMVVGHVRVCRGCNLPEPKPPWRFCVWRADGQPATSMFIRGSGGGSCNVGQHRPIGAACSCDGHSGNVVETQFY